MRIYEGDIDIDDDDYSYYDKPEDEPEPQELPEIWLLEPGPCCICGKPEQRYGCFHCGKPVCYAETYYPEDSSCGSWILDSWHPAAPEENEFYCNRCQEAELAGMRE